MESRVTSSVCVVVPVDYKAPVLMKSVYIVEDTNLPSLRLNHPNCLEDRRSENDVILAPGSAVPCVVTTIGPTESPGAR
jgi:hypothetical protein